MQNVLITYYSLLTCFDRHYDHHQGNLKDYRRVTYKITKLL